VGGGRIDDAIDTWLIVPSLFNQTRDKYHFYETIFRSLASSSLRQTELISVRDAKLSHVMQFTLRPRDLRQHKGSVNRIWTIPGPIKTY